MKNRHPPMYLIDMLRYRRIYTLLDMMDMREHIKEQIEQCNQALVQNNYEFMPQTEDAEL